MESQETTINQGPSSSAPPLLVATPKVHAKGKAKPKKQTNKTTKKAEAAKSKKSSKKKD